tara:strand:+ start:13113 stop:13736 length:624 start_codon:yes stop_codon:yes gene_type:complete
MKYILAVISIIFFVSGCSSSQAQKTTMQKIDETKENTDVYLVYSKYKTETHNGEVIQNYNSGYDLLTLNHDAFIKTKEYTLSINKKHNKLSSDLMKDSVRVNVNFESIIGNVSNNEFVAFSKKLNKNMKSKIESENNLVLFNNYMSSTYKRESISISRKLITEVTIYIFQVNTEKTNLRALTKFCFQGQDFNLTALTCVESNNMKLF